MIKSKINSLKQNFVSLSDPLEIMDIEKEYLMEAKRLRKIKDIRLDFNKRLVKVEDTLFWKEILRTLP
jgi:hypothetical protein